MKIVLFTDTLGDLNGVSRFIQDMGELAEQNGIEFVIATSTVKPLPERPYIHNLPFHLRLPMPFYQELDLVFTKKKAIKTLLNNIEPDLVHISTPGPFGWTAKKVAEKLGYPLVGTYHTDFPAYLRDLTGSDWIKHKTDRIMARFYRSFLHVFSRSESYLEVMANDIGIDYERSSVIEPGTNLDKFNPGHQDESVWKHFGLSRHRAKVLYVGRINIEKNIPFLVEVWREVQKRYPMIKADLIMVGEGRYRKWADRLRKEHAYFLGPLTGDLLSQIYASSDLFVFPSVTDTLGQVVMESQASGLTTLVSDIGGPQTLVLENQTGQVLKANAHEDWVVAIGESLMSQRDFNDKRSGVDHMQQYNIEKSFRDFIETHKMLCQQQHNKQEEP